MQHYHVQQNNFLISDDKAKINIDVVYNYLCNQSYWAKNISLQVVQKSIQHSVCFGVYKINEQTNEVEQQVGFARVITDKATFGYLADVFIIEAYRGIGLSKWLMEEIMNHAELQGFRRWMLGTKDAHGLYQQFGFTLLQNNARIMGLNLLEAYPPIVSH